MLESLANGSSSRLLKSFFYSTDKPFYKHINKPRAADHKRENLLDC